MRRLVLVLLVLLAAALPANAQCIDVDGDGYGNPASAACLLPILDCNDADPNIYPGAAESCDAFDEDCNGAMDDAPTCLQSCPTSERLPGETRLPFRGTIRTGEIDSSGMDWSLGLLLQRI